MRGLPSLDTQHTCVSPHRVAPRHRAQLHTAVPRRAHPAWHARNHVLPTHTLVHRVHRLARWRADRRYSHTMSRTGICVTFTSATVIPTTVSAAISPAAISTQHLRSAAYALAHPSAPSTHPSARISARPSARPSALQERLVRNVVVRTPGRAVGLEGARAATLPLRRITLQAPLLSDIEDAIPLPAASGYGIDAPNAQGVAPVPD